MKRGPLLSWVATGTDTFSPLTSPWLTGHMGTLASPLSLGLHFQMRGGLQAATDATTLTECNGPPDISDSSTPLMFISA
jgi:hypothetical protein